MELESTTGGLREVRPAAPGALPARIPRSRATDGAERTGSTDGSVYEPVHDRVARSLNPATVRNIVSSARPYVKSLRPSPEHN